MNLSDKRKRVLANRLFRAHSKWTAGKLTGETFDKIHNRIKAEIEESETES